jgi:mRNA-degrading endonuclease RelE of RelBE toxin-antitoxin system
LSEKYRHVAEFRHSFEKDVEKQDREMRDRVSEKIKIDQILKDYHIGELLKGKFRDYKKVKIGKYRLIYSDKEKCKIVLVKFSHRETVYDELDRLLN